MSTPIVDGAVRVERRSDRPWANAGGASGAGRGTTAAARASMIVRRLVLIAVVAAELGAGGCLYASGSLSQGQAGYRNYPTTVAEEQARRAHRRRLALLGGPLEIVGGVGLATLALYAPITQADDGDDSITDNLGDAGKELLGRLVLATIGLSVATSGVGDTVLGATDPAFASPLVRHGELVGADRIDLLAPAPGPRLGFHASQALSTYGVGADAGIGLGHWIGASVRIREAITGGWELGFRAADRDVRYALGGDVTIERAFGRRHAGLYPARSIGVYGGGSWTRIDDRDRGAVRGGLAGTLRAVQVRVGASFIPGLDRGPTFEVGFRRELEVD